VPGFSAVFVALGASASAIGGLLLHYRYEAGIAGGALVTVFGLLMLVGSGKVPFLLSALFLHKMTGRWKRLRLAGRSLQTFAALVMVVMGVALMTGKLTTFSYWLLEVFPALGKIG